jgi:DDE family transposase
MNPRFSLVADHLESLFMETADRLARSTKFVQRESKLGGSEFARALVFGWLHNPQATLEELAQTASGLGVPISPQGLEQRFHERAASFLEQLLHAAVVRVVTADPVAIPVLRRFAGGVCLLDGTSLTLPAAFARGWRGCGVQVNQEGAGIKAQVRLNLVDGTLTGPFLHPACASDLSSAKRLPPLPAGALRLADMGYFSLEDLDALDLEEVQWLTRVHVCTRFYDDQGTLWTPAAFLRQQTADTIDVRIRLGLEQGLPCRLIALRAPAAVVAKRRERMQRHWRRRRRLHPDRQVLAEWTFYVTNIARERLSVQEAAILARCRWQIELLFKLWKSEGRIDESRSEKPWRILCEIYAKLLGMVVQHWLLLVGCWSYPNRSLVKASRTVRRNIWPLALVLTQRHLVYGILMNLQRTLTTGCRINRRRRDPPTHQLLLGLAKAG